MNRTVRRNPARQQQSPQVLASLALLFTLLAPPAHAQQCIQGWDDNNPQASEIPFAWSNDFIAMTRLISYYMPSFGDGDSMTEPFWLNGGMAMPFGSDGPRETWYVPRDNLSGTAPFYRLLGGDNHMDSDNPNEASDIGYHMEFLLGYPWTSQKVGTKAISRYFNANIFDHRTWLNTQTPSGYSLNRRWDTASGTPRYGYERYANKLQWCDAQDTGYIGNSIANTQIKVDFNKVWGNAIGRIYWKGTNPWTQLVRENIGAMVQSTIFNTAPKYVNGVLQPDVCCDYNPTQSGGWDMANVGNTRRWAGSPVISASFPSSTKHVTEVKPFNFPIGIWTNADQYTPLMWKGTFRRTTTLGLTIGTTTYQDVLLMSFDAKRDDSGVRSTNHNLDNTHWLNMNPLGDGNVPNTDPAGFRIERVDLNSGATQLVAHPPDRFDLTNGGQRILLPMDGGGVMFSKNDGTFAIGFHHARTPLDPSKANFQIMFWCDGATVVNGSCPFANQTLTFDSFAVHDLGLTYDPAKQQNTYMVLGTRTNVIRRLRQIECVRTGGGTSCNSIP